MTQRLSVLFVVLLAAAFCTTAMADSIPGDPTLKIIPGGHSTDVTGLSFGPFFPFAGTGAGADCVIDPAVTGDAFCSFKNATATDNEDSEEESDNEAAEGTTFNQIAISITGELNPISCFNLINPAGGCRVDGSTITFFALGIPAEPGEWNWDFQNTFTHTISASFTASDTPGICTANSGPCTFGVPEPASALLLGTGLGALLALTRRWNLRRSKT